MDPGFDLVALRYDSEERFVASNGTGVVETFEWSPNGEQLAYRGSGLFLVEPDSINPLQIDSFPEIQSPLLSAPDSQKIAYVRGDEEEPAELLVFDVPSATATRLFDAYEAFSDEQPKWSLDSLALAWKVSFPGSIARLYQSSIGEHDAWSVVPVPSIGIPGVREFAWN